MNLMNKSFISVSWMICNGERQCTYAEGPIQWENLDS